MCAHLFTHPPPLSGWQSLLRTPSAFVNASLPSLKGVLHRVQAVVTRIRRKVRHTAASHDGGAVMWTAFKAHLALGKRLYETEVGAKQLREQIAVFDQRIGKLRAAESLNRERERMLLHLAESSLTDDPYAGLEVEHQKAKLAQAALDRHIEGIDAERAFCWTRSADPI